MAPTTRSNDEPRAPAPAASRVYRSKRPAQQIRFPTRRKVVRKYGRTDTARSPRQRTLTQIGYAVPLVADLNESEALDGDLEADRLDGGEAGSDASRAGSRAGSRADSRGASGTRMPSVSAARASKRQKMRHGTPSASAASAATASFHTQTLTQLVHKPPGAGPLGEDGEHSEAVVDTTIRDSEDEYSLASPEAKAAPKAAPRSGRPSAGQGREEQTRTPKRRRVEGLEQPVPRQALATPTAVRTEIPSSQPSPFTPMLLLGRYHSPLGRQRSSPLASRTAAPASAVDMDAGLIPRDVSDGAAEEARVPFSWKQASRRVVTDPSRERSRRKSPAPLRVLSSPEVARRSVRQEESRKHRPEYGAENDTDAWTANSRRNDHTGSERRNKGKKHARVAVEIPDSDEEEGGLSGPLGSLQSVSAVSRPAASAATDAPTMDTSSSPRWPAISASASPEPEPGSPSPLQKTRGSPVARRSRLRRPNKPDTQPGPHSSASNPAGAIEVPASSHPDMTHPAPLSDSPPARSQPSGTQPPPSQGLESQRVPLDVIRSLGPQTDRSDIIISIHPEHVQQIVSGSKDHEFRSYKIPHTVCRFWMYVTQPVCELQYMAVVASGFREPGSIDSSSGLGNAAFNAGQMATKLAYKLEQVYQLNNPVALDTMKRNGWVDGPPQRYTYVPPAVVGALLGNLRCALLGDAPEALSVSQEVEAQLLSDIAETQFSPRPKPLQQRPAAAGAPGPASAAGHARLQAPSPPAQGAQMRTRSAVASFHSSGSCAGDRASLLSNVAWPSQATTATPPSTQAVSQRGRAAVDAAAVDAAAVDAVGTVDAIESSLPDDFSPPESWAEIRRPELYLEASSGLSSKSEPATQGSQRRKHGSGRQRPPVLGGAVGSPTEPTQVVLPDSLYEEVRQAPPPAVILDSDDSEGGD